MPYKNTEDEKAYQKRYHKEWYQRNKAKRIKQINDRRAIIRAESYKFIDSIKLKAGCADCGYNKHAIALDFDHLSDKKYNISGMVTNSHSIESIEKEISKCEVVCANCHRVRTRDRRI